jgi:hypothetical protein
MKFQIFILKNIYLELKVDEDEEEEKKIPAAI